MADSGISQVQTAGKHWGSAGNSRPRASALVCGGNQLAVASHACSASVTPDANVANTGSLTKPTCGVTTTSVRKRSGSSGGTGSTSNTSIPAPAIWPDFMCLSKGISGGYLPLSGGTMTGGINAGGYILANQPLTVARWQRQPDPPGVPKDRYFLYRVSG